VKQLLARCSNWTTKKYYYTHCTTKNKQSFNFAWNFVCTKKQRKILLARGLRIQQLSALGRWNVTLLLLLLLLLRKKCEYHRTCCDYLVATACQDFSAWNERKKTPTFSSAGPKYGLRFVKKLCRHVQVLGVVAMVKDERQGCNASYCWQQLLFSVEL